MYKWFRLYHDLWANPKLASFDAAEMWALVSMFRLASESNERGTFRLDLDDLAAACRTEVDAMQAVLAKVARKRLATVTFHEGGDAVSVAFQSWDKYQPASDTSTERVRQWRKRKAGQQDEHAQATGVTLHGVAQPLRNGAEQNRLEQKRTEETTQESEEGRAALSSSALVGSPNAHARASVPRETPPTLDDIRAVVQTHGGTLGDAQDYFDLRERDAWTITNREGHARPVRNWRADCNLWTRDRMRQRAAGKFVEGKGAAEPAVRTKPKTEIRMQVVDGKKVAVEVPITERASNGD